MTITICGAVRRGALTLEPDLTIGGGTTIVTGPNGAGKTTLLRLIAGLEALDSGVMTMLDRVVDEPADGTFVHTPDRPVAMAFQDHRLFPHLSVLDNVAFPIRRDGAGRTEARTAASAHLSAVGLGNVTGARPAALSVGQRQRAALARALATRADVLLLDEPLAAIDEPSRAELRLMLRRAAPTTIWVTHDLDHTEPDDARISIENGRVRQTRRP